MVQYGLRKQNERKNGAVEQGEASMGMIGHIREHEALRSPLKEKRFGHFNREKG